MRFVGVRGNLSWIGRTRIADVSHSVNAKRLGTRA
jgi:hypothetical protein